jgi:hypothetical protein
MHAVCSCNWSCGCTRFHELCCVLLQLVTLAVSILGVCGRVRTRVQVHGRKTRGLSTLSLVTLLRHAVYAEGAHHRECLRPRVHVCGCVRPFLRMRGDASNSRALAHDSMSVVACSCSLLPLLSVSWSCMCTYCYTTAGQLAADSRHGGSVPITGTLLRHAVYAEGEHHWACMQLRVRVRGGCVRPSCGSRKTAIGDTATPSTSSPGGHGSCAPVSEPMATWTLLRLTAVSSSHPQYTFFTGSPSSPHRVEQGFKVRAGTSIGG